MRLRVATPNVLGHPAARGKPEFNKVAYRRRMRRLVCAQHGHDVNRLNNRAKLAWTEKAHHRFKERIKEITSRNRGHNVQTVIGELSLYVRGWLQYYKLSSTFGEVRELACWIRRRVRLYYWKQWKQPRTRRRNLLALGVNPKRVHMASRSRKGYWRMSQTEIVRFALNNRWLEEQGVPDMRAIWIALHFGPKARV